MEPDAPGKRFVPWVTIVIAAANLIVFAIELAAGGGLMWGPSPQKMLELGGNLGTVTLDGEPWRLFTSMFLHYGLLHVGLNMFMGMYQLGQHVERMYGRAGYAALYLFAGLAGSLASAIRGQAVSAGASGAIFGIMGAFAAFLLLHRKRFDPTALKRQVTSLATLLAINIWLGLQAKGIDMAAHIGGLVGGFLAGLVLLAGASAVRQRVLRAVLVGVLGSGLIVGAALIVKPRTSGVALVFEHIGQAEQAAMELDENLPAAEFATRLERDVLPKWRVAIEELARDQSMRADLRALTMEYVQVREQQYVTTAEALRSEDEATAARARELAEKGDGIVLRMKALLEQK